MWKNIFCPWIDYRPTCNITHTIQQKKNVLFEWIFIDKKLALDIHKTFPCSWFNWSFLSPVISLARTRSHFQALKGLDRVHSWIPEQLVWFNCLELLFLVKRLFSSFCSIFFFLASNASFFSSCFDFVRCKY